MKLRGQNGGKAFTTDRDGCEGRPEGGPAEARGEEDVEECRGEGEGRERGRTRKGSGRAEGASRWQVGQVKTNTHKKKAYFVYF